MPTKAVMVSDRKRLEKVVCCLSQLKIEAETNCESAFPSCQGSTLTFAINCNQCALA